MRRRLSVLAYRLFGRFPRALRLGIVRVFAPTYTLGALCLIERADGDVLLVSHVYRQGWGIPGGLLQRGEDPATAARREVREEVGLDVELVGEPSVVVSPEHQRVDLVFRGRPSLADGDGADAASAEILAARWFPVDALPQLQRETATALVALARGALAPHVLVLPMTDAQLLAELGTHFPAQRAGGEEQG